METKNRIFIRTPFSLKVFETLDKLRSVSNCKGSNKNLMLSGESGSGKSALLIEYASMYPDYTTETLTIKPVLYVELNRIQTERQLYTSILSELGAPPLNARDDSDRALEVLRNFVHMCQIEILLLDEVQTVFQNRSLSQLSGICDWFKRLIEALNIPIVLAGMPWLPRIVEDFEQLQSRVGYRFSIPNYKITVDFVHYISFVKSFFKKYRREDSKILGDLLFYTRLFAYTSGNVRTTISLLNDLLESEPTVKQLNDFKLIASTVAAMGVNDSENPFTAKLIDISIREIVSPSDWDFKANRNKSHSIKPSYRTLGLNTQGKPISASKYGVVA